MRRGIRLHHARTIRTSFLLCCLACPLPGHGQPAGRGGDTIYHLHGTVVDGVTGKPLTRALVLSPDRRLGVMTDGEGRFQVDLSVPPRTGSPTGNGDSYPLSAFQRFGQTLYLSAQKPGYIQTGQQALLPLDDSLSSTEVKIKLMPAAIVTGRISAAGTDSAANVHVLLLLHQVTGDGTPVWQQAGSATANSRGEFHFANLRPGEYTVMTQEWRGDQPSPQPHPMVTQRYPPTFYGDVSGLDAAIKLRLHYGDTPQVELHLHLTNYYRVAVPVANSAPTPSVGVQLLDQTAFNGFQLGYNSHTGMVEGLLPSGHYTLLFTGNAPQQATGQSQQSFAVTSINVSDAPLQTASIALSPSSPVMVRVHDQLTGQQAPQPDYEGQILSGISARAGGSQILNAQQSAPVLQLILRDVERNGGYMSVPGQTGHNDELMVPNVPPGRYFVHPQVYRGGYVASLTCGGVDLLRQPLVVGSSGGTSPIDAVVRDDNPKLSGTVTSAGGPLPQQMFIMFLPTDSPAQFTQSYAGPDGKFTVPNLAPGSYRVLALAAVRRQLPYNDAEWMRRLDGKGSTLTANPGQTLQIDTPLIDDADMEDN